MLARRLMHRCGEPRIAASAASAVSDHHALVGRGEIEDFLAGLFVVHNRSHRNFQKHVSPIAPGFVRAFAVTSALRFVFRIETEVHQRVVALAGFHNHVAALAAVAAGRSAARNELLAAKRHAAVSAAARIHPNFSLIDKHEGSCPTASKAAKLDLSDT